MLVETKKGAKIELVAAVVVDRLTGEIVSKHRSYSAADKAATKRGDRYAVRADRAYA